MIESSIPDFTFYQSCVIPYRVNSGKIEVLLITSLRKKKWIVPKGFVEFNLSAFESAKKEAYEEAGVLGANETTELGEFRIEKGAGLTIVKVYSMEVTEELDSYPEMNMRKRKWYALENAVEKLEMPQLKTYLNKLNKIVSHS
ncbi:MAG TPA: NUDIX hydrolase [Ignavibacteriaceae bacterium]|nr:NUDIX hydrolase [Ignavibacteriaceae bacterium]